MNIVANKLKRNKLLISIMALTLKIFVQNRNSLRFVPNLWFHQVRHNFNYKGWAIFITALTCMGASPCHF